MVRIIFINVNIFLKMSVYLFLHLFKKWLIYAILTTFICGLLFFTRLTDFLYSIAISIFLLFGIITQSNILLQTFIQTNNQPSNFRNICLCLTFTHNHHITLFRSILIDNIRMSCWISI